MRFFYYHQKSVIITIVISHTYSTLSRFDAPSVATGDLLLTGIAPLQNFLKKKKHHAHRITA